MRTPIRRAMLVAAVGLATACADMPTTGNKVAGASNTNGNTADAVTCKTVVKTGTRIGTRVCKTNRQWEQERQDSRAATEAIQRGSVHGPGPAGN